MGLRLALAHPDKQDKVVYLARPCQYAAHSYKNKCTKNYWTSVRYASEVVDNANQVISTLKLQTETSKIVFVGYSGGGTLAMLMAAKRQDVVRIITVAADLDINFWTKTNELSPLSGSADPARLASAFGNIPQIHFVGNQDETVSPNVVKSFMLKLPKNTPVRVINLPGYDHSCCWVENWPKLYNQAKIQFPDTDQN